MQRFKLIVLLGVTAIVTGGCAASYVTPSGGVSFADIEDGYSKELFQRPGVKSFPAIEDLQPLYERQPASPFPANIAIVRVQDSGYSTRTSHGYGSGRFSIVTTRDIESDQAVETIEKLPLVGSVAPLARLLLPANANTIRDLLTPAAKLRADLLLIYSVDTTFSVSGHSLGPLSLISLGLIPNKKAHVTATVAGVLVDVRTGFVYGSTEATAIEEQRATLWSTELAIDSSRIMAEEKAFESFVTEFQTLWGNVLNVHAAAHPNAGPSAQDSDAYYRVRFDAP